MDSKAILLKNLNLNYITIKNILYYLRNSADPT